VVILNLTVPFKQPGVINVKKLIFMIFGLVFLFYNSSLIYSQDFSLGLVADGALKPNAEAAYKWAQKNFKAQVIPIPKNKADLVKFGVIWWDESNGPAIPDAFKDKAVVDAFLGYVKDGGGLLISSLAFHYVYEMGIEPENMRYFGVNAATALDWTDIMITPGQEKHSIFKGLKVDKGLIQYDIQGFAEGSDFYAANGPLGPKNGTLLAQTVDGHPQCNPLVEYRSGSGTILAIGWVWSSWVINAKLEDVHGPLYINMLKYLASRSKFAAVDSGGKLETTWALLKVR
jgi:hypothetical protein